MKVCYLLLIFLFVSFCVMGQGEHGYVGGQHEGYPDSVAFCNALSFLINDASQDFVHTRGNVVDNTNEGVIYSVTHGLPGGMPGGIVANVVYGEDWSYECVIFQGDNKGEMNKVYVAYKSLVDKCLAGVDYVNNHVSDTMNGLEKYPAIMYMPKKSTKQNLALKVAFSTINNFYTVTITVNK
jgi:hypothetical protein